MKYLVILITIVLIAAWGYKEPPCEYGFEVGDLVVSALSSDLRGQIIHRYGYTCSLYDVRWVSVQSTTNTSFLGGDGAIDTAPLAKISFMRDYELIKYQE